MLPHQKKEEIRKIANSNNYISIKKLPPIFAKYNNNSFEYKVFKIPLSLLTYNKKNGRTTILSLNQKENINELNDEELNEKIEKYILNSNEEIHEKTKNNIKLNSQQEPGVILDNGIVIDGNRRFTCLRVLNRENPNDEKFKYFEAVVLNSDIVENKDIKLLELNIQLGKDEKQDYDIVERNLDIYNTITSQKELTKEEYSEATGISKKSIEESIEVIEIIKEYLEYINQNDNWTLIKSKKIFEHFKELLKGIKKKPEDEKQDIKQVVFDYILLPALGPDSKKIRNIIKMMNEKKNEKATENFLNKHIEINKKIKEKIKEFDSIEELSNELINNSSLSKDMIINSTSLYRSDLLNKAPINSLGNLIDEFTEDINKLFNIEEIKFLRPIEINKLLNSISYSQKILEEKKVLIEEIFKENNDKKNM